MASDEPSSIVVCDAGPLIHLDELRCLNLLGPFERILVPERVCQEVRRHQPSALRRRKVFLERVHDLPEITSELAALVREHALAGGETEAFRLMEKFPTLEAFRLGLKTKRQTLNILRAVATRSSLHVSRQFLNSVISQVREASE